MRNEKFGSDLVDYLSRCRNVAEEARKSVVYMFNGTINNVPFTPSRAPAYRSLIGSLARAEEDLRKVLKAYEDLQRAE